MNLLEYLKAKRNKLKELQEEKVEEQTTENAIDEDNIEIVIENHHSLFAGKKKS